MLWLPTARRAPLTGQPGFAWQVDCPPKGVAHTTESAGLPSYTPGLKAPHVTVLPRAGVGVDVDQHIPFNLAAYALVHAPGTVATNGAHAIQIELAGTCDPNSPIKGAYYWPKADDAVLKDLYLKVIGPISAALAIPLTAPTFKAYPSSAGANGVRLTESAWLKWRGWLGHQHAPGGNDHGDPGAFPWARLVQLATPEDDMPTKEEIAEAVWAATFGTETAGQRLALAARIQVPTVAQITAAVLAALKANPLTAPGTISDADVARIVKASADEISKRLGQ